MMKKRFKFICQKIDCNEIVNIWINKDDYIKRTYLFTMIIDNNIRCTKHTNENSMIKDTDYVILKCQYKLCGQPRKYFLYSKYNDKSKYKDVFEYLIKQNNNGLIRCLKHCNNN